MNCQRLRLVYAGTPDFAVPALKALIDSDHEVIAVYTQPDRPAGRGRKLTASPIKQCAESHGIPVYQPVSLRDADAQKALTKLDCDIMIVAAYGLLLPQAVLDTPRLGCINIHASLLPRWRGAAPIQRAIQSGDSESGVTIMQMAKGLDTGDMLGKKTVAIHAQMTAGELHDKLAEMGRDGLLEVLPSLCRGEISPEIQDDSLASYAGKISKQEAEIDWSLDAKQIHRSICAFNPFPVAFTHLDDKVVRLWRSSLSEAEWEGEPGEVVYAANGEILVATGEGLVRIDELQMPGKKAVTAEQFLNGRQLLGQRLGKA